MHAQDRAWERYNSELEVKDIKAMTSMIKNGNHLLTGELGKEPGQEFCYLKYRNIPYKLLIKYDKDKPIIITMYPFDPDEYNELREECKIRKAINFLTCKGYKVEKL